MSKRKKLPLPAVKKRKLDTGNDPNSYKDHDVIFAISRKFLYRGKDKNRRFDLFANYDTSEKLFELLSDLETRHKGWTWRGLEKSSNKTSSGMMDIEKLDEDIKRMVKEHIEKKDLDVGTLYKIECNNRHRLWGIRNHETLFIVWDDPQHEFYKHIDKNYTPPKKKSDH